MYFFIRFAVVIYKRAKVHFFFDIPKCFAQNLLFYHNYCACARKNDSKTLFRNGICVTLHALLCSVRESEVEWQG